MTISATTSAAGSIRVGIQDAEGKPIPGFSLANSAEIYGDQIDRVVRWKGKSDVSQVANRPIRLHFVMKDADLYAVQFR